jgi:uncharacterized membrane protein HdeD (DUF308 family)
MQTTPGTPPIPSLLPHLWKSTLVSGILSLILGVLVLAWPGISVLVAAIWFGVYLLISGIAEVVFAFSLHVTAGSRILLFISGAASLILAVLAFRHFGTDPRTAILLLAIWIGVGFIFRGVATTVSAISDPMLPGRGWSIFVGVITLLAGIVVIASPFDSIITLAIVVGAWFVVIGVFEIVSSFGIRKASKTLAS